MVLKEGGALRCTADAGKLHHRTRKDISLLWNLLLLKVDIDSLDFVASD